MVRVVGIAQPVAQEGGRQYPAGSVLKVDDATYAEMRERMPDHVYNLTPRPLAAMISALFRRRA